MSAPDKERNSDLFQAPAEPIELMDIHLDAIHLWGLLYVADSYEPMNERQRTALASLLAVALPLARKVADQLEEVM